jgi:hypothetical protein
MGSPIAIGEENEGSVFIPDFGEPITLDSPPATASLQLVLERGPIDTMGQGRIAVLEIGLFAGLDVNEKG